MQGRKTFEPKIFYELSLDRLVPQDDFYRKISQEVPFSFLYKSTSHYYGNCGQDGFFNKRTLRYLKDVSDHINQAREMVENYRESISNIQDLYLNQENNKLSRSMKVTAIVTCLLAPATVIGGIFGMNFKYIPFLNNPYAFYIAIAFMLLIPVYMIYVFKKNGWF